MTDAQIPHPATSIRPTASELLAAAEASPVHRAVPIEAGVRLLAADRRAVTARVGGAHRGRSGRG